MRGSSQPARKNKKKRKKRLSCCSERQRQETGFIWIIINISDLGALFTHTVQGWNENANTFKEEKKNFFLCPLRFKKGSSEILAPTSCGIVVIHVTHFNALGIQEYVEAVSFLHYIRHRSLISLEEINARLVFMRTDRVDHKVNV